MLKDNWSKKVFLTLTDTTIGFISKSSSCLDIVKERPSNKEYITALSSLKKLKSLTRVPQQYKNQVRRANKSTFIFPNGNSYRLVKNIKHKNLIDKLEEAYTTSANISGGEYNKIFAEDNADIIISFSKLNKNSEASDIFRITIKSIKKIR